MSYYRNIESDIIYACTGDQHLFRLVGAPPGVWQFLVPGSPQWDEVHQYIYWAGRTVSLSEAELPAGTPPVPEPLPGPYPSPESYYLPAGVVSAAEYPHLATLVRSAEQKRIMIWVVLEEDTYETMLGDGEYHYLQSAHFSEEEAAAIAAGTKEYTRYHLRNLAISISETGFSFPDFKLQLFDRYEPVEILTMLEESLQSGCAKRGSESEAT